jgi:hypothetical protein
MMKRKRTDLTWWVPFKKWIQSNGGFVHSNIELSEDRELFCETKVDPDTIILKIPAFCLATLESTSKSAPWLAKAVDAVGPSALYSEAADVLIALFLASQSPKELPYLDSLPDSTSFDALPRRWSESQLESYLAGSPLMSRIVKARAGVQADYDAVLQAYENNATDEKAHPFPSFETFSDMLAAVSSRAFGIGNHDDNSSSMVPLLDLCNHSRGKGDKKNLSYQWNEEDGCVQVTSTDMIDAGGLLQITYGARGNGQLLLNYGFAVPNNLEPDNSSNDVLEFGVIDSTVVELRTGPKSYTYGGFVKALESFYKTNNSLEGGPDDEEEGEDDMEAFLDDCDLHEEQDIYGDNDAGEDGGEDDVGEEDTQNELEALAAFRKALEEARKEYKLQGDELRDALNLPPGTPGYYAALVVQSEYRTINFFLRSIEKVTALLKKSEAAAGAESNMSTEDAELVEQQTEELAQAFIKIRHSDGFL